MNYHLIIDIILVSMAITFVLIIRAKGNAAKEKK